MSKVIWKQQLKEETEQTIPIPKFAQILSVKEQLGVLCIWYLRDIDDEPGKRTIYIFTTGQTLPEYINELSFIGTSISEDNIVLHIFQRLP